MKNVLVNRRTIAYRGVVRDLDSQNGEMTVESGLAKDIHRVRWDKTTMFTQLDRPVNPNALYRGGKVRFEGMTMGTACLARKISILS